MSNSFMKNGKAISPQTDAEEFTVLEKLDPL